MITTEANSFLYRVVEREKRTVGYLRGVVNDRENSIMQMEERTAGHLAKIEQLRVLVKDLEEELDTIKCDPTESYKRNDSEKSTTDRLDDLEDYVKELADWLTDYYWRNYDIHGRRR